MSNDILADSCLDLGVYAGIGCRFGLYTRKSRCRILIGRKQTVWKETPFGRKQFCRNLVDQKVFGLKDIGRKAL